MHGENDDDLQLLRALCQAADAVLVRRACRLLRRHRWLGEHLVIYESCAALAARGARISSRTLAAETTRAGFPDLDLDGLFAPLPSPDRELAHRLEALEGGNE